MASPALLRGVKSCDPAHKRDRNRGVNYTGVISDASQQKGTQTQSINKAKQHLTTLFNIQMRFLRQYHREREIILHVAREGRERGMKTRQTNKRHKKGK
jgi:hypothetical protein